LEADRVAYRKACRSANTLIVNSRRSFYQQKLQAVGGEQKVQWRVIRELLHSEDRNPPPEPRQAKRLCLDFCRFFNEKLTRIAGEVNSRLVTTSCLVRPPIPRASSALLDSLPPVMAKEVAKVICQLPPKSLLLDVLPVSLLKQTTDIMAPLIAELANLSFTSGVFPARYNTGRVVPLLKKPGLPVHDPANYRPITNLCTFSKILEKLFLARLQPRVMQSGNYCKFQSAYRKGCSTETALVRIVSDIQRAGGEG